MFIGKKTPLHTGFDTIWFQVSTGGLRTHSPRVRGNYLITLIGFHVELTLHYSHKSHFIMVCNLFYTLLALVYWYFVEDFCIYFHKGYWYVVFLWYLWLYYQGSVGLIEWVAKYLLLLFCFGRVWEALVLILL